MGQLMLSNSILTLIVAGVAVVFALTTFLKERRRAVGRRYRLPPGPAPLPFVGNLFSIDARKPWMTYAEWAARYGDIFKIRVFQQDIIVINSEKIAKELLDRRSRIYSDRPYFSTREPYGWSFNFAFEPYGNQWRSQRRIFHQAFKAESALTFHPTQLRKARQLVSDILNAPHDYHNHIQRYSVAVLMGVVYDYDVARGPDDHLVELLERGSCLAIEALTPEMASLVATFPFLLDLPEWFPGAAIRRRAAISKAATTRMIEEPFEWYVRKRQTAGSSASAMDLDLLKGIDDPLQLQLLKNTCATAVIGGADTTTSTLRCFVLAMLQNQEVQAQAQAEIDAVVGRNRLPNFEDRPNLPYVEAILLETLRLYSISPLGISHATVVDDVYEDICIPKGFSVVANIWAMQHNKYIYPEPDIFRPERFLVDGKLREVKSVESVVFGFGRRICPGRRSADSTVWIAMVSILSAFKIMKAINELGEEIEFEPTFSYSLIPVLEQFPCSITPRVLNVDIRELLSAVEV